MHPRFLLDTHILLRWLTEPAKLSSDQARTLERTRQRAELVAFSAITLVEITLLVSAGRFNVPGSLNQFFSVLESNPIFRVLPITHDVALDIASLASLKDPADRIIVATARVHRLPLLTSDERLIKSKFVQVVE